jgi:hypothetical protein
MTIFSVANEGFERSGDFLHFDFFETFLQRCKMPDCLLLIYFRNVRNGNTAICQRSISTLI